MTEKTKTKAIEVTFSDKFQGLFVPARYKIYYGGRGSGKSWACGRGLIIIGAQKKVRVLCAREIQNSIADSVHKLLCEQIDALGLGYFYRITKSSIIGLNGTEFMFSGLRINTQELKSKEGIDICWVEEAQAVSDESWSILIPTIRKEESEIWATFNPIDDTDPTYQRFVVNPPPNSIVQKVSWRDNPWFPDVLRKEMEYLKRVNYDSYLHIWEGETLTISEATILRGKVDIRTFETPEDVSVFYYGADWGFSQDPTAIVRAFILDNTLFIDYEAYGIGVDIDKTPALFDRVPGVRDWKIYADSSRPETISYMRQRGFRIEGAPKWSGSVHDGIAYLRSFEKIVVHSRCKHVADETRLYKYKVDARTGDVLPIVVDADNHTIDALRYALSKLIRNKRNPAKVLSFTGGEIE